MRLASQLILGPKKFTFRCSCSLPKTTMYKNTEQFFLAFSLRCNILDFLINKKRKKCVAFSQSVGKKFALTLQQHGNYLLINWQYLSNNLVIT